LANPPKQKGTAHETAQLRYYQQWWPDAYRTALKGSLDTGDINGLPLPIECKNEKMFKPSEWLKEAEREAENAKAMFCPVNAKRKGITDPAKQLILLENWMLVELMLCMEKNN
jgi:hypothetical protein